MLNKLEDVMMLCGPFLSTNYFENCQKYLRKPELGLTVLQTSQEYILYLFIYDEFPLDCLRKSL